MFKLAAGKVQGTGQRPFLVFFQACLDDLRAVVAEFIGNLLAVVAVDDLAAWPIAIDQDRHQDAVDSDVVPKCREFLVGQRRQFQNRLVLGLLLGLRLWAWRISCGNFPARTSLLGRAGNRGHQTKSRLLPASRTNYAGFAASCGHAVGSHKAVAVSKGMTETVYGELTSIVSVANMTNRLVNGLQVSLDENFQIAG